MKILLLGGFLGGITAHASLAARGAIRHAASLGLFAEGGVAESSQYPDTASFRLLALDENPGAIRRAGLHHGLLDRFPPGPDFVTCGCLDGTLVEFCSGPCDQVAALCEEACRGYGHATLFTACVPDGCP